MILRVLIGFAAALALLASPAQAQQGAASATLTIHADQPGAEISRHVYGQFAEHLGRGIYEGVWVGPGSRIPNTRGFRNDVVEALRALHVPNVRWPGGCYADIYHWRNGIGPRARRPVTINSWWGMAEENNAFGTHEFFDFAELIGADAYLNVNMGTATAGEMMDWLEYITSDSNSTLAQERRANGRAEPWKLPFLTIGNETWGCGGNMSADAYAMLYRQYATFVKTPENNTPMLIASGGHGDLATWTDTMMSNAAAQQFTGLSLHQYTLPTGSWTGAKGAALAFPESEWASTLSRASRVNAIIEQHAAIMDRHDPQKRVALVVDEWGTWYDTAEGASGLYQQNSLRDAVVAAVHLNIFHNHADRVRMTNIAQMVNVLQAMILTDGPRMLRTPTYHVFEMYLPFHDATSLPIELNTPNYRLGDVSAPAVSASAAIAADGHVRVALANTDPNRAVRVNARIDGLRGARVTGRILTAATMDAHNTFDAPDTLVPTAFTGAAIVGDRLTIDLPAKSVVVLTIE